MLQGLQRPVPATCADAPPCKHCFSSPRRRTSRLTVRTDCSRPPCTRLSQPSRAALVNGLFADVGTGTASAQTLTELLSNKPLVQHALQSIGSTVAWFALAFFVTRIFTRLAKVCETPEEPAPAFSTSDSLSTAPPRARRPVFTQLVQAVLIALHVPVSFFVPLAAIVYSLRSIAWFVGTVLAAETKRQTSSETLVTLLGKVLHALQTVDASVISLRQLGLIIFGCWTLLRFKESIVKSFMDESLQEVSSSPSGGQGRALERVMLPFSGLASWFVVCAGSLMCLSVLGINVKPLLTVGGVGTVVVGLSAQSVLANLVCGISLFLSRPFVVGDRVELSSGGGERVLVGVIERVDPMRTIVRTDASLPVTIPNKVLSEMIISNESNILTSRVLSHFNRSRQLLFTIKLRYKDLEKVELVVDEMRRSLQRRAGVDRRLPQFVGMSGFQDYAINIVVLVHTTPVASRDWGNFRQRLLMDFGRIINKHAVQFAYPTQVTHMPNLEEAILQTSGRQPEETGSPGSNGSPGGNGAGRPPSPTSADRSNGTGMEIEHSQDGAPPKVMAEKAALALGNDAHSSQDLF